MFTWGMLWFLGFPRNNINITYFLFISISFFVSFADVQSTQFSNQKKKNNLHFHSRLSGFSALSIMLSLSGCPRPKTPINYLGTTWVSFRVNNAVSTRNGTARNAIDWKGRIMLHTNSNAINFIFLSFSTPYLIIKIYLIFSQNFL